MSTVRLLVLDRLHIEPLSIIGFAANASVDGVWFGLSEPAGLPDCHCPHSVPEVAAVVGTPLVEAGAAQVPVRGPVQGTGRRRVKVVVPDLGPVMQRCSFRSGWPMPRWNDTGHIGRSWDNGQRVCLWRLSRCDRCHTSRLPLYGLPY